VISNQELAVMFKALTGYLRSNGRNGFIQVAATRTLCAVALILMLSVAASAYTIVLRSGRRIEIPANFTVTNLTLTYESAPGINITLLISTIDVQATELANNEPAGALLKRAEQLPSNTTTTTRRARPPRRELTRQDIERARRERQKSEEEYERRRIELGLPSLEEMRRRTEEETKRLSAQARLSRMEESEAESYWRTRSSQLRTEMAALDSQILYVRARLAEIPQFSGIAPYGFVTNIAPVFPLRQPRVRFPVITGHPGFMRGDAAGARGVISPGSGALQAQLQLNAAWSFGRFGRRGHRTPGIFMSPGIFLSTPYQGYDDSYERANLISRLHELEAARAGVQARWRLLEEEARRAGAQPGWLRP
jgi:hypothetical protein